MVQCLFIYLQKNIHPAMRYNVVYEYISRKRLSTYVHDLRTRHTSVQIERRLLNIFVVLQRRNLPVKSDSDYNYHKYILRNWTMCNLSPNRKEVLSSVRCLPGAQRYRCAWQPL